MNEETTYVFHEDAGHGWLEVPVAEIQELGIAKAISTYSYVKGDMAYLEEDCDAPLFMRAKGWNVWNDARPFISEVYDGNNSPIRNYGSFRRGQR